MKIEDQYKRDIENLIKALKTDSYGDYSKEQILDTVFAIIKSELPSYEFLSKKQFQKLSIEEDLIALQEILDKGLYSTVPANIGELVEILDERPIGKLGTEKIGVSKATQTPEYRLRAALNYWESQQAASEIFPSQAVADTIESERAEEIKAILATEDGKEALAKRVLEKGKLELEQVNKIVDAYKDYIDGSSQGQNVFHLDPVKVVAIPADIAKVAEAVAVIPLAVAAKEKPDELILKIQQQIKARNPSANSQETKSLAEEYVNKLSNLTPNNTNVPVIEGLNIKNLTVPLDFGSKREMVQIASYGIEPSPIVDATGTQAAIDRIKPIEIAEAQMPAASGFWASSVGRTVIDLGLQKMAKEGDPEDVLDAMALKTAKQIRENAEALRNAGVNDSLVDIFQKRLERLVGKDGKMPDIFEQYIAGQGLLDNRVMEALSKVQEGAIGSATFEQVFVVPVQGNFLQQAVNNLGVRLVGGWAKNKITGEIQKRVISKAGKFAAVKGSQIAAGLGLTEFTAAFGTFMAGPVGTAIVAAIGWFGGLAKRGFGKHWGKLMTFAGVALGALIGGPVGAFLGGFAGAAFAGLDWKKIGRWVKWGLAVWASYFAAQMILPLIVTLVYLIGGTMIFSLIIFIINAGAYVVPPGSLEGELAGLNGSGLGQNITSPYIDVVKTVDPAGPFQNSDLPLKDVKYHVIVKAKKGSLTNIKFENKCNVINKAQKSGADIIREQGLVDCNPPIPADNTIPKVIDPGKPYEFDYTMTYDGTGYQDAFVTDTFTVTADAAEKKGAVAASSATIKIGNPPEDCPQGWPVDAPITITQGPQGSRSHQGYEAIDIAKVAGTPVHATHSGVATILEWSVSYGKHVMITSSCNGKSFESLYAHLQHIYVKNGDIVTTGEVIGAVDSTGKSDGNHLHYEFRPPGTNDGPVPASQEPLLMEPPYIPTFVARGG